MLELMKTKFYKYQGAGNDFVILDNRDEHFDGDNVELVASICDRRFGVGADGMMLLQSHPEHDFVMRYFNADGREASMCGNGGRCIVAFARKLGLIHNKTRFLAVDGIHEAVIDDNDLVNLKMQNVPEVENGEDYFFLDTGSPHYVRFADDVDAIDVVKEGRKIRNSQRFAAEGTNVNFVQLRDNGIKVYTYERGVEDETLACGTGITASALCAAIKTGKNEGYFPVEAKGGQLEVAFKRTENQFTEIWLKGPATFVFDGTIAID
ncbi:diaminopimelate epimerase [Prolixibacter bellariivorans]|uniref:Diaminopimelate epimerase n=2 Tax=Prolixibacter bellariivorans TaxID=314319 RepID=A0A5M4AZU6_9BACT|nr:diaminopimelate epimerase [Prolixibacter bellariivorans]